MATRARRDETAKKFAFKTGDLVLVKWNDGMVYFAKIKRIDRKRSKCVVVFDDKSQDDANFDQIHSVDETTTDIICIKCKKDNSDPPNEIVLCDSCGIGFHRRCHIPLIPASAIDLDTPWNCSYCQRGTKCPFLTESLDVLQNLLSDEERDRDEDEEEEEEEEAAAVSNDESDGYVATTVTVDAVPRKRKGLSSLDGSSKEHKVQLPLATVSDGSWKSKPHSKPQTEPKGFSDRSSSTPESVSEGSRKRKKRHLMKNQKKHKRSSVAAHTVSVQRLPVSIHDESNTSTDSNVASESESVDTYRPPKHERPMHVSKKRPRSLRVSLSLPEEVEEGSPLDKVVKAQKLLSPSLRSKSSALPSWDDFSANAPKKTSPLSTSRSSSVVSHDEDSLALAVHMEVQPAKRIKLSLGLPREEKPISKPEVAFVATPLPSTPTRKQIPSVGSSKQEAPNEPNIPNVKLCRKDTSPVHVERLTPPSTLPCKEYKQPPPSQQPKSAATPVIHSAPKTTRVITIQADQIPTNAPTAVATSAPSIKSPKVNQTPSGTYISTAVNTPVRHSSPERARQSSPDLIITAVESPKRAAASSVKTPTIQSVSLNLRGATSAVLPDSNRQSSLALEARPVQKRVTAKIVEIQQQIPLAALKTSSSSSSSSSMAAGSLVLPITSQTPVSMVSVMVSPTVPTAIGSSQYITTVPSQQATQTPVQYIATKQPVQKTQVNYSTQPPAYSSHMKPTSYVYVVPTTATPAVSNQITAITTTKPYAIVNALPPSATSQSGVEYIGSPSSLQNVGYVQLANASALQPQAVEFSGGSGRKVVQASPLQTAISPKTGQQTSFSVTSPAQQRDAYVSLHSISKKIEGAFATCSEDMLISAFEDAWKKFQANGSKFKRAARNTAPITPPNAEVVSIPGHDSRLSLVRSVRSRPKPIAPKASSTSHTASPVQQRPAVQYVQYPAPNQQLFTVVHQDGTYRKQAKTYQSSGLFYPSPASDSNGIATSTASGVRGSLSVRKVVTKPAVPNQPTKATRTCTLCGEDATYLCSGCHNKWYCGRGCQLKAWDEHSKECKT